MFLVILYQNKSMSLSPFHSKHPIIHYSIAFAFIITMIITAFLLEDKEIILPEIAAMTVALWVYREKEWMRHPEKIFIMPSITAVLGFAVNMLSVPYVPKLAIILLLMVIFMRLVRYSFPPALATGFLAIVTNAHEMSFLYAIFFLTFVLMVGVYLFKLNKDVEREGVFDTRKLLAYFTITSIWLLLSFALGIEQMALIPPITVVMFESLNMKKYSLKIATKQTVVLTLSISIAVLLTLCITNWVVLTLLFLVLMNILLRIFQMKVPAVYAFPLLIYVFPTERVMQLPIAALLVSMFSFGMVLIYRKVLVKG